MKLKIVLSTASALALLTGAAWAGSSNTLYIDQDGTGNTANVQQSFGTGGNDIGSAGSPFLQQGNNNDFRETQATGGGFSNGNNDILKAKQVGNNNVFTSYYSNNAGSNVIKNVLQNGNSNVLAITRNNQRSGTIGTIVQGGNSGDPLGGDNNGISIEQVTYYLPGSLPAFAGGNSIDKVTQIGSNNRGYGYAVYGTTISQGGSLNRVMESSIEGSNNTSSTNPVAQRVYQRGIGNGQIASIARTLGSGGNSINITEVGDQNNFDVRQGVSVASTGNHASVTQTGNDNNARATQYGSFNDVAVIQNGNGNMSTTLFNGDGNGNGNFTPGSYAAGLTNPNLMQGQVFQDSGALAGSTNLVNYTVYGSNNLFAFAQLGGDNTINGKVGTATIDSINNEVSVLQNGSNNVASFSQLGAAGGNNLAVSQ